jgi:uncharacterized protein YcaQ
LTITKRQARRLILAHQGLWPPYELEGKSGILDYIRRVGCIQFDPHKVHTRKVYDFAHRHIPGELLSAADPNQTEEQYQDWYVLRRIGSVGLLWNRSGDAWLGMPEIKSKERNRALTRLLRQGKVVEVYVEGLDWLISTA